MVKVDLTRDYYGDLELPSTANVEDIKKQFRKLGMPPTPNPTSPLSAPADRVFKLSSTTPIVTPGRRRK